MKIAMFGHKHFPSREGGIEVVVAELAKRMSVSSKLTIYDRYELDKKKRHKKRHGNITLCLSPTLSNSKLNAMMASFFSTIQCCIGNYDIVHIHAEGPSFFCWLLKLFNKKTVVTIHGIDWQRSKWEKFAKWYLRTGEKMSVKYADEIIVLSQEMHDYFMDTYGRETNIIRNGVRINRNTKQDKLEAFGLQEDGYILYLGRLVPEKRVDLLIEAYKELDVKKKLVIAGPLDNTDYINSLKQSADGNQNILFTGFVTGPVLEQLYTNCSLFVLPSDLEGMSISLLEAMGYGIPCLASDIPENRNVLQAFGYFFESGNKERLKDEIVNIINHAPHFNKIQQMFVMDHYDWDHVSQQTLALYKKVIRRNQNG